MNRMRQKLNYTISRKPIHGFTLVELLVVISIIALLLSIMMPALSKARDQGKQVVCRSQLHQISIAAELYSQDNRDYFILGRWHNGGDWFSVNTWYSNLTPYLIAGKSACKVYSMTNVDARKYNKIWEKLVCPAERLSQRQSEFQGISLRTYGTNMGSSNVVGTTYYDGYGLQDWNRGEVRKLTSVKVPAGMMAFCDVRDWEYVYAEAYTQLESSQLLDSVLPKRHPGGYNAAFVDGHVGSITTDQLKDSTNRIWRIK